jgi:perosamine synthetase
MLNIQTCLEALTHVLGEQQKELPLHEPSFLGNEWTYVKACLDSGWVSSVGEYVNLFEKKLIEYTGVPYAIAVVNGTAALHICLMLADVKANDEVLIPAITFVATANAVSYCGAHPHFVDCSLENLGIDVEKLNEYLLKNTFIKNNICINKNTGRSIKAIVPVHIFGHPVRMQELQQVASAFKLTVIEDASESLGSYYNQRHTGHFGEIACLSFNGNKVVTTGGGGAILTANAEFAKRARHITTTAKRAHRWEFYHDEIGYNYRLPNINAALGCAQLENLSEIVQWKRALAKQYITAFDGIKGVFVLQEPECSKSNYWLNALILETPDRNKVKDFIEEALVNFRYGLRGLWNPLDSLPMYQQCPKMDLSNTYRVFNSVICLPSSPLLGKKYA